MKYVKLIHETPMNPIETFEGEFIEEKVARVVENKELIIVTGKQIGRAHV